MDKRKTIRNIGIEDVIPRFIDVFPRQIDNPIGDLFDIYRFIGNFIRRVIDALKANHAGAFALKRGF